jgi:methylmalonyl-CoA epimerase
MIRRLDHIGIAVDNLEEQLPFWAEALGLTVSAIETVESEQVKVAFLPVGESRIELLEATTPESPIARHLERRGPGVHHLTFEVGDLDRALEALRGAGVQILGDGARVGAGGHRVAFLHPKSAGGVLVELCEGRPADAADAEDVAPGAPVLLYMREPQEKMWGILRRLDPTGVTIEGIDLGSFDDWLAQIDGDAEDAFTVPSIVFVPISRVERVLLDRPSGPLPSLTQRAERRAGCSLGDLVRRQRSR